MEAAKKLGCFFIFVGCYGAAFCVLTGIWFQYSLINSKAAITAKVPGLDAGSGSGFYILPKQAINQMYTIFMVAAFGVMGVWGFITGFGLLVAKLHRFKSIVFSTLSVFVGCAGLLIAPSVSLIRGVKNDQKPTCTDMLAKQDVIVCGDVSTKACVSEAVKICTVLLVRRLTSAAAALLGAAICIVVVIAGMCVARRERNNDSGGNRKVAGLEDSSFVGSDASADSSYYDEESGSSHSSSSYS